jgi:Fic family protein
VDISGTTYHPLAIPQQLEDYFRLILAKTDAIKDPFEQAFFLMIQIPYLQPFEDVNKRISRLGANIPLISISGRRRRSGHERANSVGDPENRFYARP